MYMNSKIYAKPVSQKDSSKSIDAFNNPILHCAQSGGRTNKSENVGCWICHKNEKETTFSRKEKNRLRKGGSATCNACLNLQKQVKVQLLRCESEEFGQEFRTQFAIKFCR